MDYEKKYKEAQKWIESIYSELSHEQQMEAEAFFPELKESEDEKIRKELIKALSSIGKRNWGGIDVFESIAWLEKQGEQKPAWSEEDETGWTNTMIMIKEVASNHYTKDSIKLVIDWLKSLKERYTWKPSDEQMEALHDLNLTGNISYAGQGQILIELYNDLKKLTE